MMGEAFATQSVSPLAHHLEGPPSSAADFGIDPSLPRQTYNGLDGPTKALEGDRRVDERLLAASASTTSPQARHQTIDGVDGIQGSGPSSPRRSTLSMSTAANGISGFSASTSSVRAPPPPPLVSTEETRPHNSLAYSPGQTTNQHSPAADAWLEGSRSAPYYVTYPAHVASPAAGYHSIPHHSRDRSAGSIPAPTYMSDSEAGGGAAVDGGAAYDAGSGPAAGAETGDPNPAVEAGARLDQSANSPVFPHFPPRAHSVPNEYSHGHHLPHHPHPMHAQPVAVPAYPYPPHGGYVQHIPPHPAYHPQQAHYEQPDGPHNPATSAAGVHSRHRYQYVGHGYSPTTLSMPMPPQSVALYFPAQPHHPSMQHAPSFHHGHADQQIAMSGRYGIRPSNAAHERDQAGAVSGSGMVTGAGSASSTVVEDTEEGTPRAPIQDAGKKQPRLTKSGKPRLPRQLISCDFCRMRKLRCDGQRPCGHCARRSRECHYQEAVRKRGKGKKAKEAPEEPTPSTASGENGQTSTYAPETELGNAQVDNSLPDGDPKPAGIDGHYPPTYPQSYDIADSSSAKGGPTPMTPQQSMSALYQDPNHTASDLASGRYSHSIHGDPSQ